MMTGSFKDPLYTLATYLSRVGTETTGIPRKGVDRVLVVV